MTTYHSNSILTDDLEVCYVCARPANDLHHIMHGADKKISEKYGLMVPLCRDCHNSVHHVGGELDIVLKQDAQRQLLIDMLGRCYL